MNKQIKFNPDILMDISYENRIAYIRTLPLFKLNICYNHFNKAIISINTLITKKYVNNMLVSGVITVDEYQKCSKRLHQYEQLLSLINDELNVRKINERFLNK